jgi:hypothetical protein
VSAPVAPRREAGLASVATRSWIDVAVLVVLSVLGIVGLETSFGTYNFLLASLGGLAIGVGVAVGATLLRLSVLVSVAAGIVAYFVLGTPIVMPSLGIGVVLPSLDTLAGLVLGAVFGWRDILTLSTPVEAPYYISVLPYFAAWLVGLVTTLLALRWFARRPASWKSALLLLGPALLFLIGILLGTDEPYLAAVRGIAFAAIALVWLGWRRGARERVAVENAAGALRRRVTGIAVVVAGAVVLGVVGGTLLTPERDDRFVLREAIEPPFDPTEFPSPLSGYRDYTKNLVDTELFTVEGLEPNMLVRLATMDSYDGVLWRVTAKTAEEEGSGSFRLVGETLPDDPFEGAVDAEELQVQIGDYDDVWVPSAGYATQIDFEDAASRAEADSFRYNATTGTGVLTGGLESGYRYTVDVDYPRPLDDSELEPLAPADVVLPAADNVPDILGSKALEYTGEATTAIGKLRALEQTLKTSGYLSHGLASDGVPSRAGHGADRMNDLFELPQMVGDEEQFASAFALMARSLGYPSRVVMGFAPEVPDDAPAIAVTGDDVTAWVEVPFEGVGWVPFFPTPDETDIPQDQVPKPQLEPQPQVRQPPRMESSEEDLLTPVAIDDSDEDRDELFNLPAWVVTLGLSILIPAAIVFIPMLIVALVKRRRARRRRRGTGDESVAGSWDELIDRLGELGYAVPARETRVAAARQLEPQVEGATLVAFAERADTAVFSGAEIPPEQADRAWTEVEALRALAAAGAGRTRRILSRYRVRRAVRRAGRDASRAEKRASRRARKAQKRGRR